MRLSIALRMRTMKRYSPPMISLLLLILLCSACSGSADEAPAVQDGLGNQAQYSANATQESAITDGQATATISAAKAQAESTLVWDGVILTQTAAPPKATAAASSLKARTAAVNQGYRAAGWVAVILLLVLIPLAIYMVINVVRRTSLVRISPTVTVYNGLMFDDITGKVAKLGPVEEPEPMRFQHQLAQVTQDAPYSIEEPSYEPAALAEPTG